MTENALAWLRNYTDINGLERPLASLCINGDGLVYTYEPKYVKKGDKLLIAGWLSRACHGEDHKLISNKDMVNVLNRDTEDAGLLCMQARYTKAENIKNYPNHYLVKPVMNKNDIKPNVLRIKMPESLKRPLHS